MGAVGSDKAILAIMTWSDREEWRDRREKVVEDHLGPVSDALELTPDEIVEAALRQVLDRHYRETLTSPLPMLGGRTPKQAVRSKAGRQQVVTWLKSGENQDVHRAQIQDGPAYDFTWIWDALGIAHLRQ